MKPYDRTRARLQEQSWGFRTGWKGNPYQLEARCSHPTNMRISSKGLNRRSRGWTTCAECGMQKMEAKR